MGEHVLPGGSESDRTDIWWEGRREGEATNVYLSRVLSELGAHSLALKAELYHYDDFRCPDHIDDGFNIHRLCESIYAWGFAVHGKRPEVYVRAMAVRKAAMRGEFDCTNREASEWSHSPEGKSAIDNLIDGQ